MVMMLGSHTSKVLQARCSETNTSGEGAVPNIPSAPAKDDQVNRIDRQFL